MTRTLFQWGAGVCLLDEAYCGFATGSIVDIDELRGIGVEWFYEVDGVDNGITSICRPYVGPAVTYWPHRSLVVMSEPEHNYIPLNSFAG